MSALSGDELDLLYGVPAIAKFSNLKVPQTRYLVASGAIPTFKMPGGRVICATKSRVKAAIAARADQASKAVV